MKCASPQCFTWVFITVDCCHGAEFVKKKKKKICCLCSSDIFETGCQVLFCFLFFFSGKETLPVDLLEEKSKATFICDSVLWQYMFTKTQAKNNVRKQTLLWYFISDFINTIIVVVAVVVPQTPAHIIWGQGALFSANAAFLTKWSLVETLEVTEVGLIFSCSCMLKQLCSLPGWPTRVPYLKTYG